MGKKTLRVIIILILSIGVLNAYAESKEEICFHSIKWLSNESTTKEKLNNYILSGYSFSNVGADKGLYLIPDEDIFVRPVSTREYSRECLIESINGSEEEKIAGYRVKEIILTFSYDGIDSKLINVKIHLIDSQFDDLKTKLTKVYGEGKCGINADDMMTAVWEGPDNTCVLLYSVDEGKTTDLIYGRIDALDFIESALAKSPEVDPDDVSGL